MKQLIKKPIKIIKIILALILAVVTVVIGSGVLGFNWQNVFSLTGFYADKSQGLSVSFIDVGKADAIYITCDGYNILVDSGEDIYAKNVCTYLERYNVEKLDLLVATHPDNDHIGGMEKIINTYNVQEFWQPKLQAKIIPESINYQNMMTALEEKEVSVYNPEKDYSVNFGDLKVTVLSPDKQYSNTNDSSIVLMLEYFDRKYLLMGDAEKKAEQSLVNNYGEALKADVLKVSHHGSNNGSGNELLQYVSPEYAVISIGENTNNLPSKACVQRLENSGCQILRTDLQGTITINALKNGKIVVHTEK